MSNRTPLRVEGGEGNLSIEARAKRDEARRARKRDEYKRNRQDPAWRARRAAYMSEYRKKAPATKDENPHDPRNPPGHGTLSRYKRYKCRCVPCKMANRDAQRKYRTGTIGPEENLR